MTRLPSRDRIPVSKYCKLVVGRPKSMFSPGCSVSSTMCNHRTPTSARQIDEFIMGDPNQAKPKLITIPNPFH